MKCRALLGITLFAPLLAQAQGGYIKPIPVVDLHVRQAIVGASILPPQELGWFMIGKGPTGVAFGRRGDRTDNTFSASVIAALLDNPISTSAELTSQAALSPENTDPRRFRIVSDQSKEDEARQAICIQKRTAFEDRGAAKRSSAEYLVTTAAVLVCRHPDNPRLVLTIHLSERDQPGRISTRVEALASEFQKGFRFEPASPEELR
jgi:hypothetical protein